MAARTQLGRIIASVMETEDFAVLLLCLGCLAFIAGIIWFAVIRGREAKSAFGDSLSIKQYEETLRIRNFGIFRLGSEGWGFSPALPVTRPQTAKGGKNSGLAVPQALYELVRFRGGQACVRGLAFSPLP